MCVCVIIYVHVKNQTNIHPRSPEEVFSCASCNAAMMACAAGGQWQEALGVSVSVLRLGAPSGCRMGALFLWVKYGQNMAKHGKNSPFGPLKILERSMTRGLNHLFLWLMSVGYSKDCWSMSLFPSANSSLIQAWHKAPGRDWHL